MGPPRWCVGGGSPRPPAVHVADVAAASAAKKSEGPGVTATLLRRDANAKVFLRQQRDGCVVGIRGRVRGETPTRGTAQGAQGPGFGHAVSTCQSSCAWYVCLRFK